MARGEWSPGPKDVDVWFELQDGTFENGKLIRGAKYRFMFNPSSEEELLETKCYDALEIPFHVAGLRSVEVGMWDSGIIDTWAGGKEPYNSSRTVGSTIGAIYSCDNTADGPMSESAAFTYKLNVYKVPAPSHKDRPYGSPPQCTHGHPMQPSMFEEGAYARGWVCDQCVSLTLRRAWV